MKLKIIKEEPKQVFEPIKMEMTLETPEEARLMWHVFNVPDLKKRVVNEIYNDRLGKVTINRFSGDTWDIIDAELIRQGVKKC
jgi:hypothetical protein